MIHNNNILDKATVESFLSDKKVIKIDLQFTGDNAWLHILYIVYSIYCVLVGLIFNLSDTIVLIPRYVNSDNINNNSRDISPFKTLQTQSRYYRNKFRLAWSKTFRFGANLFGRTHSEQKF